jgi:hypothetical protein
VQVGSRLGLTLQFDNPAVDAAADPNFGSYAFSGGTYGLFASLGAWSVALHSFTISIINGTAGGPDLLAVYATNGVEGGLNDFSSLSMLLQDDSGTAFSSDALPSSLGDIGQFNVSTFDLIQQFTDANGNFVQYEIQGNLVPEPTTFALVFGGLLSCAVARHRQSGVKGRVEAAS